MLRMLSSVLRAGISEETNKAQDVRKTITVQESPTGHAISRSPPQKKFFTLTLSATLFRKKSELRFASLSWPDFGTDRFLSGGILAFECFLRQVIAQLATEGNFPLIP